MPTAYSNTTRYDPPQYQMTFAITMLRVFAGQLLASSSLFSGLQAMSSFTLVISVSASHKTEQSPYRLFYRWKVSQAPITKGRKATGESPRALVSQLAR